MKLVPVATIADCCRAFASGEGRALTQAPCIDVFVRGWTISVFDDACEFDWLNFAIAPDGTRYEYEDLNFSDGTGVENLLSEEEKKRFMARFYPDIRPPAHSAVWRM